MGTVISFEERAVATLRDRLGAAESAKDDLIAFARGHSGATAAIHSAVLALMEADGPMRLMTRSRLRGGESGGCSARVRSASTCSSGWPGGPDRRSGSRQADVSQGSCRSR